MRQLRQADLCHGGDDHARLQAASDRLVLGRLSYGHALQWRLALQLQKQLALGSYKSAWLLCAKLRRAMCDPNRNPLGGLVEVDETEIPLRSKDDPLTGGGGRSAQGKMLVAGAVEIGDGGPGRIRLAAIRNFSAASLHGFIGAHVEKARRSKPMAGRLIRAFPMSSMNLTWSGAWPPMSCCPGPTACFPTSRHGRSASITAAQAASAILPRRVRLSLQPPPFSPRGLQLAAVHRSRGKTNHLQYVDRTESGISLYRLSIA